MANSGIGVKFVKKFKPNSTSPFPPVIASLDKTTIWLGTESGSFTTSGNWSNGVPDSGDTVIFNQGSVDLDADLNQISITVESLLIHSDYTGNIGDGTNPLQMGAELVKINKRSGFVHLAGVFINVHVLDTSGATNAVKITTPGALYCLNCYVYATRSDMLFGDDARLFNCWAVPQPGRTVDLIINDSAGGNQINMHADRNSFVTLENSCNVIDCDGGVLTLGESAGSVTLTLGGGTLINQSDGTHTAVETWNGTFSMHQHEDSTSTLTDLTTWGGQLVLRNNLQAAIVTNPMNYWGGEVWTDVGSTGAVS